MEEEVAAELRAKLVDELDPALDWRSAFERVPRHVFVPRILGCWPGREDGTSDGFVVDATDGRTWLELVYSDRLLIIADEGERHSSSSMPSMMLRFLELLQVEAGSRVLEIGTGSGYNAALLCERLGSANVTTLDIDAELAEAAAQALRRCGYSPTLAVADGYMGRAIGLPYDRIIATCAVPRIPTTWREQLVPGGILVTPLDNYLLVALRRQEDGRLEGRCHRAGAAFMDLRSPAISRPRRMRIEKAGDPDERSIDKPPDWMLSRYLRFYAGYLTVPGRLPAAPDVVVSGTDGDDFTCNLTARDGSWAHVSRRDSGYVAAQAGPRRLWDEYEARAAAWLDLGKPRWDRMGLTVHSDDRQVLWLDSPDSEHCWEL